MLQIDTKEQQDAIERILDPTSNWIPDLPCDGVHIDDYITFDQMAEIVNYLRGEQKGHRKIEYRGRSFKGEWLFGYYAERWLYAEGKYRNVPQISKDGCYWVEVAKTTVGQFSGLIDKNGKKIFEGDVVRWDKDSNLYVVEFRRGMFYANVEPFNKGVYGGFPLWTLCKKGEHCSVVGNIHDNNL